MIAASEDKGEIVVDMERRAEREDSEGGEMLEEPIPGADEEKKNENTQPKTFKRKLAIVSSAKVSGTAAEPENGQPTRKRRWGARTSSSGSNKKPSFNISTESLKSLIPDMKPLQEAVVDLHADDAHISEEEKEDRDEEKVEDDEGDKELKIIRTVTQMVHVEGQENGDNAEMSQKQEQRPPVYEEENMNETEDEEEDQGKEEEKNNKTECGAVTKGKDEESTSMEVESPVMTKSNDDDKAKAHGETLVRRAVNPQKTSVSVTLEDSTRAIQRISPPRHKPTCILHVYNLVRPFTLFQLKELLNQTGILNEEVFWIDKIKSHCYATYTSVEEAVVTRNALHGVKWPLSNPKVLGAEFADQEERDFHRGLLTHRPVSAVTVDPVNPEVPQPQKQEREHEPNQEHNRDVSRKVEAQRVVHDLRAEREREMARRERARGEREWDRGKVHDFDQVQPARSRSRSQHRERERERDRDREREREKDRDHDRHRRDRDRPRSREKNVEKKEKVKEEPPAKLLDDLFKKTKATPCIYWLPLTEEQFVLREAQRAERAAEREKRRKELKEVDQKKQEERKAQREKEQAEREKEREKEKEERGRAREEREREREERGRAREEREGERRREQGGSRDGDRDRERKERDRDKDRERRRH